MATDKPRVALIKLDGLFRQYDHSIPLQREDRVTILHGRNGVGKTVTLSLVAALLNGQYSKLLNVPFRALRIELTDGSFLEVQPSSESQREIILKVDYAIAGGESKSFSIDSNHLVHVRGIARGGTQPIARGGQPIARGMAQAIARSPEDDAFYYGEQVHALHGEHAHEPEELRELRKQIPVHFIEAQRLFKISSETAPQPLGHSSITSAMKDIAEEMAEHIKQADSTYRTTSTRLDDSLPARLFAPTSSDMSLTDEELNRRTEALERERIRLREIGLVADSATAFNPKVLNDIQRGMFVVYLKDNEEKLAVFKELADRAEILLGIINHKFSPKRVKLDKDDGYKAFSHDGRPLDLDVLSSGEQHELVLLHNLLFRVEEGALLLIDEPELSLHVTWQNEFLEDLIQITKKVGFDALVATHSPYIVGTRRDLMVRLGEPV